MGQPSSSDLAIFTFRVQRVPNSQWVVAGTVLLHHCLGVAAETGHLSLSSLGLWPHGPLTSQLLPKYPQHFSPARLPGVPYLRSHFVHAHNLQLDSLVVLQSDPGCPETPWAAEAMQGWALQACWALPHLEASI